MSMLRWAVLIVALLLFAIGAALIWAAGRVGWPLSIGGLVIATAVLIERWRYQAVESNPTGRWQSTGERFEDPETGKILEVLYDPATGRRCYVAARDTGLNR